MSQEKRQPSRLVFQPQTKGAPTKSAAQREEERLRAARERAAEYRRASEASDMEDDDGVTRIEEWADIVTKRIEEAMRRGDFDNLPGRGKPARVQAEPFVPVTQQMAFSLLKNNDLTPSWIAERKEMLKAVETWRADFQRVVGEAQAAWVAASDDKRRVQIRERWATWLTRWEDEVRELNRRIGILNLKQPINHLEIFKLRLDDELRDVGVARTLGD